MASSRETGGSLPSQTGAPAETFALTGTNIEGTGPALQHDKEIPNCTRHTNAVLSSDNFGLAGSTTMVDSTWTQLGDAPRGNVFVLYCFGPN